MERLGDVDGFLAEGAVDHEEDFVGLHAGVEAFHFFDQLVVDLQPAGGVENDAVGGRGLRGGEGGDADGGDVLRDAVGIKAEFFLLRKNLQLVDGGGAVNVAAHDEGPVAALFEQLAELGRRGRLAGAVETDHQNFQRARGGQGVRALAEELHQLVVDDLDDLLAGGDALQDFLADALGLDALDELTRDLEMHVRRKQGGAHFFQSVRHVFFRELTDAAEVAQGVAEFFRERFEH